MISCDDYIHHLADLYFASFLIDNWFLYQSASADHEGSPHRWAKRGITLFETKSSDIGENALPKGVWTTEGRLPANYKSYIAH